MGLGVSWHRFAFRVEGLWVRVEHAGSWVQHQNPLLRDLGSGLQVGVQNEWWESSAFLLLVTRV